MKSTLIAFEPKKDRGALLLGGEPHVVHCHYYNHFLQTSIEDAEALYPVEEVLVWTAQEVAHSLFRQLFLQEKATDIATRKALVEAVYSRCGYGRVQLSDISADGGEIATPYEHYAYTYAATFPPRSAGKRGVAYFSQGYLAGAIEAIYDLPLGSMGSQQVSCLTQGHSEVRWRFERLREPLPLQPSVGEGAYETGDLFQPPNTRVPMAEIRDAVLNLPLAPDPETGLIEAFGVVLTFISANYYSLISERHLARMQAAIGPEANALVLDMLIESGHVCAFNTLGGIMQSAEWDAVVRPYLDSPEDWIYGITACMPAIGWGIVQNYHKPLPNYWTGVTTNWYESTALASLSKRALDHSPFARGLFAGMMALVYTAGIHERTLTFDGALYKALFGERRLFSGEFLESRLRGEAQDRVEVRAQ